LSPKENAGSDKSKQIQIERKKGTDNVHGMVDLGVSVGAAGAATVIGLNATSGLKNQKLCSIPY